MIATCLERGHWEESIDTICSELDKVYKCPSKLELNSTNSLEAGVTIQTLKFTDSLALKNE